MVIQGLASTVHVATRARLLDALRGSGPAGSRLSRPPDDGPQRRGDILDLLRSETESPKEQEPAKAPPTAGTSRSELLSSIRKRIKKGFYNTDAVLEDLSDSFAGVFDKLT